MAVLLVSSLHYILAIAADRYDLRFYSGFFVDGGSWYLQRKQVALSCHTLCVSFLIVITLLDIV